MRLKVVLLLLLLNIQVLKAQETPKCPVVDAGKDQTICVSKIDNTVINLSGHYSNGEAFGNLVKWTLKDGGPDAKFSNQNGISTSYNPTPAQIQAGSLTFTFTVTNIYCPQGESDIVKINFLTEENKPVVDAGQDTIICNTSLKLYGTVNPKMGSFWKIIKGSGSFGAPPNDASNPQAIYNAGTADFGNTVQLMLQDSVCGDQDTIKISFQKAPDVVVVTDHSTSCDSTIKFTATIENSNPAPVFSWSVTGTKGRLENINTRNPILFRGEEVSSPIVTLKVYTGKCTTVVQKTVNFTPVAFVDATIIPSSSCKGIINLKAVTRGIQSVSWSVSAPGKSTGFSDINALTTSYTPESESGKLLFTVKGEGISTCFAQDTISTKVLTQSTINISLKTDTACTNVYSLIGVSSSENAKWSAVPDIGKFDNVAIPNPTYTVATDFSGTIRFTYKTPAINNNCPPISDSIDITYDQGKVEVSAESDNTCSGKISLKGNVTGRKGKWTTNEAGGSFLDESLPTTTYTAAKPNAGLVTLVYTVPGVGKCKVRSDTVKVNFTTGPVLIKGPSPGISCYGKVSLQDKLSGGSGKWTADLLEGKFTDPLNPTTTFAVPDNFIGSVKLIYSVPSANSCPAVGDTVIAQFKASPSVNIAQDSLSVCTTAVSISAITNGSGKWISNIGSGGFLNAGAPVTTFTPPADFEGVTKLTFSIPPDGLCPGAKDSIKVVFVKPVQIDAGPTTASTCTGTITLNGVANGTKIIWSSDPEAGTFDSKTSAVTTYKVPDDFEGKIKFKLAAPALAACPQSKDSITVAFTKVATISLGTIPANVCNGIVNLNPVITNGNAQWSRSGEIGHFGSATDTKTNFIVPDDFKGTITLKLSIAATSACPPLEQSADVNFFPVTKIDAGPATYISCDNKVYLNGTVTNGTGQWTAAGNRGEFSSSTIPNPVYTAQDGVTGSIKLYYQVPATTLCPSVKDSISVAFGSKKIVDAGIEDTMTSCSGEVALAGDLIGRPGKWISDVPGGTFANPRDPRTIYNAPKGYVGPVRLTLSSDATPNCPITKDSIILIFNPGGKVDAGPDTVACSNTIKLQGSGTGGKGIWTADKCSECFSDKNNETTTYTASQTFAGFVVMTLSIPATVKCPATSDKTTVVFGSSATADAGPTTLHTCSSSINLQGKVTGGVPRWTSKPVVGNFSAPQSATTVFTPPVGFADTIRLYLTSTATLSCKSVKDSILVSFNPVTTVSIVKEKVFTCNDTIHLLASATGGISTWTAIPDTGKFSNIHNPVTIYTKPANFTGDVILQLTIPENGSCTTASDKLIANFGTGISLDAGDNQTLCSQSIAKLKGTVSGTQSYKWTSDGSGKFSSDTDLNATYTPSAQDLTSENIKISLVAQSSGACATISDMLYLSFVINPIAHAGEDINICASDKVADLIGTIAPKNSGFWKTQGNGKFDKISSVLTNRYIFGADDIKKGKVTLILSPEPVKTCIGITDSLVVNIVTTPVVNAGEDKIICVNATTVSLNGAFLMGQGIPTWSTLGKGTIINKNDLNTTYNINTEDIKSGSITFILSVPGTQSCKSSTDEVIYNFSSSSVIAGKDQYLCSNNSDSVFLKPLVLAAPVLWSSSGNGNFLPDTRTANAIYVPDRNDLKKGKITLTIKPSTSQTSCTDNAASSLNIFFSPSPVAKAGEDFVVCLKDTIKLNGVVENAQSGKWSSLGNGKFFPDPNSLNAFFIPGLMDLSKGNISFILKTEGNGLCKAVADTLVVNFNNNLSVSAGNDQSICSQDKIIALNGFIQGPNTNILWSSVNGSGTFTPINAVKSIYRITETDRLKDTLIFKLKAGTFNCSSGDELKVAIRKSTITNAGLDQILCGEGSNTVHLEGKITGPGTAKWMTKGGGKFEFNNSDLKYTYLPDEFDISQGKVLLILGAENTGTCPPVEDSVTITFSNSAFVFAGDDQQICYYNKFVDLKGQAANSKSILWSALGDGRFISDTSLKTKYLPGLKEIKNGKFTLKLSSTGKGSCKGSADSLEITIIPHPAIDAGNDLLICKNMKQIDLYPKVSESFTTKWKTSGTGTFQDSSAGSTQYIPSIYDKANGKVNLFLSSHYSSLCLPIVDTLTVLFNTGGAVEAGVNQSICANEPVKLNGSVTGGIKKVKWSTSGNGTFFPSDTSLKASYKLGTLDVSKHKLFLTLSNPAGCSVLSDTIIVDVRPNTVVSAGQNQFLCEGVSQINLKGEFISGSNPIKWETLGKGNFQPQDALSTTYYFAKEDLDLGSVKVILSSTGVQSCSPVADTISLNIIRKPIVRCGEDIEICSTASVPLNGKITGGRGTGKWSSSGTGKFSSDTSLNTIYRPSVSDVQNGYLLMALSSTGNTECGFSTDTLRLIIRPIPGPEINRTPDLVLCSGAVGSLGNTSNENFQYLWKPSTFISDSIASNPTIRIINKLPVDSVYTIYLIVTESSTGCTTLDTVSVHIRRNLNNMAGRDTSLCSFQPYFLGTKASNSVSYYWTGTGLSNDTVANPILWPVKNQVGKTFSYSVKTKIRNSNCSGIDTINIKILNGPEVYAGNDTTLCASDIFALGRKGPQEYKYKWTPSVYLSSDSIADPKFISENNNRSDLKITYKLAVSSTEGCINYDSLRIVVHPKPFTLLINNDSTRFCGQPYTGYYELSSNKGSSYHWSVTGGTILEGEHQPKVTINWDNSISKQLVVTEKSDVGCKNYYIVPLKNGSLSVIINKVTKNGDNTKNYIYWNAILDNVSIDNLILKRNSLNSNDTIVFSGFTPKDTLCIDSVAIDPLKVYNYTFSFRSTCGGDLKSISHHNLALSINQNFESTISLITWNSYENWQNGVSKYELWRKTDNEDFLLFSSFEKGSFTTNYIIDNKYKSQCFKIKAIESESGTISWSNINCINTNLNIPNAISPNNDGVNDQWIIDNLVLYPDNEVKIYNQWHAQVYSKKGYKNNWQGENLPDGTYYYIINTGIDNSKDIKGYILITR